MVSEKDVIKNLFPTLVEIRRHLHMNPELGHKEFVTAEYIEECLKKFGVEFVYRPSETSVCALIGDLNSTNTALAFRADIDALPITEENSHSYVSNHNGIMHACGHDVHTTIVLGLASVLTQIQSKLKRPIKLIFQQAEEVYPSGAPLLINSGVLTNPTVDEIYGIHVWPDLALGTIGLKYGALMGAIEGIEITVSSLEVPDSHERGGGKDAIQIAAAFLSEIQDHMHGRLLSDDAPVSLAIGIIQGGSAPGRFAQTVELRGSVRSLFPDALNKFHEKLNSVIAFVSETHKAKFEIKFTPNIRPHVINSQQRVNQVIQAIEKVGNLQVKLLEKPLHCSEDFGWFMQEVEGAFIFLGSASSTETSYELHNPSFEVDEKVIEIGVSLLTQVAIDRAT